MVCALKLVDQSCICYRDTQKAASAQQQERVPRQLQEVSGWRSASTAALLDPAAAPEDVAVVSETRRAALLEREGALSRWAVSLELQAARQAASAASLRAAAAETEKQRTAVVADGRAADARRGQLDILAAELSKEREYLTKLAQQLAVRWGGAAVAQLHSLDSACDCVLVVRTTQPDALPLPTNPCYMHQTTAGQEPSRGGS